MKIIAYDSFKPGVQRGSRKRLAPLEGRRGQGNYARADVSGVVIVIECKSVDEAKCYVDDFPLTKRGSQLALHPFGCAPNRWSSYLTPQSMRASRTTGQRQGLNGNSECRRSRNRPLLNDDVEESGP